MDLTLAKSVADKPEEDDALRKRLWLRCARHVVQQASGGGVPAAQGGVVAGREE